MVEVKEGMIVSLADARGGTGSRGEWYFVPVRAEKGSDRITIWAANPQKAKGLTGSAKVTTIKSVKLSARKGRDEKWYPEYSVEATLGEAALDEQEAFEAIAREINDDDLPFA